MSPGQANKQTINLHSVIRITNGQICITWVTTAVEILILLWFDLFQYHIGVRCDFGEPQHFTIRSNAKINLYRPINSNPSLTGREKERETSTVWKNARSNGFDLHEKLESNQKISGLDIIKSSLVEFLNFFCTSKKIANWLGNNDQQAIKNGFLSKTRIDVKDVNDTNITLK